MKYVTEEQEQRAQEMFYQRLTAYAKHAGLDSSRKLARDLQVSKSTILTWRTGRVLPTRKIFDRIRTTLGFATEEATLIRRACAARKLRRVLTAQPARDRPSARGPGAKKASSTRRAAAPSPAREESLQKRVKRIEQILSQIGRAALTRSNDAPPYDELIADNTTEDWTTGGVRFALTKENFRLLDGSSWSVAEIKDTCTLIEELRRRLALLAQVRQDEIRRPLLKSLGRELDELWIAYEVASSVVPIEAVEIMSLQRESFREKDL